MEMLKEMAVFAQVVDSGGFSACARHLGMTTSAVSRHVARLEAQMGARLLVRTTRSLALTEVGQQVYDGCARMLGAAREVHTLAGSYSARPNGLVRISAPTVFGQLWLAPKLPGFLARYPEVDIKLTLIDRTVDLVEEGVDLAIRVASELAPGLAARPLCPLSYLLAASPGYLASHPAPTSAQDLATTPCIYLDYARFYAPWHLSRAGENVQIKVPTRCAINNSAAILAAVQADGGIGLMLDFMAREAFACGSLQQVLPDWQIEAPSAGTAHVVYMPGKHLALKIRVFIDYLLESTAQ
jgi:DNA-binding transcriptional LysR family regulator